jgi:hypothetical protein
MKAKYWLSGLATALGVALAMQPASAKCLSKTISGASDNASNIIIVVPDDGTQDPAVAGYQQVSCEGIDKIAYRQKICSYPQFRKNSHWPEFDAQTGLPFAQLCQAAKEEAGIAGTLPRPKPPGQFDPDASKHVSKVSAPLVGALSPPDSQKSR